MNGAPEIKMLLLWKANINQPIHTSLHGGKWRVRWCRYGPRRRLKLSQSPSDMRQSWSPLPPHGLIRSFQPHPE